MFRFLIIDIVYETPPFQWILLTTTYDMIRIIDGLLVNVKSLFILEIIIIGIISHKLLSKVTTE